MDQKKKLLDELRSVQANMARVAERRRPSTAFTAERASGVMPRPSAAPSPEEAQPSAEATPTDEAAPPPKSERAPLSSTRYTIISPRSRRDKP